MMDQKEPQIPLDQLKPLHCGVVVEVQADHDEHERLMAMGVCAGRTVELIQVGDPLILKVYGTRVGVSARLASKVLVDPCRSDSCRIE
jgi:Fe2+ transport system protein FeoA